MREGVSYNRADFPKPGLWSPPLLGWELLLSCVPHDQTLSRWNPYLYRPVFTTKRETASSSLSCHLHGQVVPHHVGIQLRALALSHHCSPSHHDVLLSKSGGKV